MKKYLLLPLLGLLAMGASAQSYWEKLKAPGGGEPVRMVETSNGRVYADFYDSVVYCSYDKGIHWNQIFAPSPDLVNGMQQIRIGRAGMLFSWKLVPGSGFPYQYNIFKSEDNAASWQIMLLATDIFDLSQTGNGDLFGLRNRSIPNGYQSEIVRSTDGGVTWQVVFDQFGQDYVAQIEVDQYDHLLVKGHLADISKYTYSVDHGITWVKASSYEFTSGVYAIAHGYFFFIHDELPYRLSRWNPVTQQSEAIALPFNSYPSLLAFPDGKIWVATDTHMYESTDDGQTWTELFQELIPLSFSMQGVLSDGTIMANGSGGIYRSTNQGQPWQFSGYEINRGEARAFIALSPTEWVALTGAGLWETPDAGQNWSLKKEAVQHLNWGREESLAKDSGDVFYMRNREALFRYERGMGVFTDVTPAWGIPPYWNGIGVNPATHTVFATTPFGVVRSTDQGVNWQTVIDTFRLQKMEKHPSGALYAIMDSVYWVPSSYRTKSYLFVSTDDGLHWAKSSAEDEMRSFTIAPDGVIYANSNSRLLKLPNGSQNWIKKEDFFYGEHLAVNSGGQLASTLNTEGIQISGDGGLHWQVFPQPILLDLLVYQNIDFDPQNHLYAIIWQYGYPGSWGHLVRSRHSTLEGSTLKGVVYKDADGDCSTADAQEPLPGWAVSAKGADEWFTTTDSLGNYSLFLDTGAYIVRTRPLLQVMWEPCPDSAEVVLSGLYDTITKDVSVKALADCPYMTVDLGMPFLRRCFDNSVYVNWQNIGTELADSVWVDVALDPHLIFMDTLLNHSYSFLGNNTYRFFLGGAAPGSTGSLVFQVYVDCDSTTLGQTLCSSAHIYPDSVCVEIPNWSGAQVIASAYCEQDTAIRFEIKNTGTAPSGLLEYIIIEDDIVLMKGHDSYDPGQTRAYTLPANGHFRRMEVEQEPGHPFSQKASAWVESCGGAGNSGFVNWYFLGDGIPSEDVACTEIVGSFDPNDKQGFPLGYGPERRIRPGQDLEYLIRFQNTGTDTAFTVVVRDTLSAWLDPASVRPGAASHPYSWTLSGQGVLTFSFANILLPDSTTNLAGSQGFVSFHIAQQPEVPLGTKILNNAGIYFDFNPPVITNQTLHTVGVDYLSSTANPAVQTPAPVQVSPNPAVESTTFQLTEGTFRRHLLTLTDALGRTVRQSSISGNQYLLERKNLPAGIYAYRVEDPQGRLTGSGKVVFK